MHACPEKDKEIQRLKDVKDLLAKNLTVVSENRKKYNITTV